MTPIRTILPLYCFLASILISCKKTSIEAIDKNMLLWDKFAGDYRVESIYSDGNVDIDMDGVENTDMFRESLDFKNSQLWIHISNERFLFEQMWPEQYPSIYEGKILHVNFVTQGDLRSFEFLDNNTKIVLTDTTTKVLNGVIKKAPPTSIRVISEGKIEVKNTKTLYTSKGLKEINFTSVYSPTGYNKGIFR
ncbi:hypothetical protein [Desertivirga arenae]|uniref:hypothetical protein n=1 Tax=Desertivirga arenae TaxID=2810309 RepID=UPI001A956F02|nr:hypothetical protein [Pedobacter sp. SYSU D00823]